MSESREDSIYFARLSEQAERYEDMIKYMKIVAKVSQPLYQITKIISISFIYGHQITPGYDCPQIFKSEPKKKQIWKKIKT